MPYLCLAVLSYGTPVLACARAGPVHGGLLCFLPVVMVCFMPVARLASTSLLWVWVFLTGWDSPEALPAPAADHFHQSPAGLQPGGAPEGC